MTQQQWSTQDVHTRVGHATSLAGDPAEDAFRRWRTGRGETEGVEFVRYGADKVSTVKGLMAHQEPFIQHAIDFVALGGHVYECQGFGRDQVLKLKLEKLVCLYRDYYAKLTGGRQFRWFFYDQPGDRYFVCTMESLLAFIRDARVDFGPRADMDGKLVYSVPVAVLEDHCVADALGYEKKLRKEFLADLSEEDRRNRDSTLRLLAQLGLPVQALADFDTPAPEPVPATPSVERAGHDGAPV